MNKFIILLACVVSLTAAGVVDQSILGRQKVITIDNTDRIVRMSRDELLRQKFLLDVLLNVQQPLVNEELLRLADTVVVDQDVSQSKIDDEVSNVIDLIRNNRLLGKDEIFTITNDDHLRQMVGIYRLLVSVRDWDIFTRIVANIRKQGNGVLLVNTLLLAVRDREDTQMLIIPGIQEILPELYLDEDVIRKVQNIDLTHLVTETDTIRPSLMDVIGMNKRTRMMNRGLGGALLGGDMNILTKSHLWMPWREMRMQLALQKMGGIGGIGAGGMDVDKTNRVTGNNNMVVIPLNNQRVGMTTDDVLRTMLTDDMGLKTFVHGLVNNVILNVVNEQNQGNENVDNVNTGRVGLKQNIGVGIRNGGMDVTRIGRIDRMNNLDDNNRVDDINRLSQINRWDNENNVDVNTNDIGIDLDDTLPTTNINNNRLLHVNRRRLQANTDVNMNVGGRVGDRTWMQNDRNQFLNVMHRGLVQDGRRVVGIGSNNINRNINDVRSNRLNLDDDVFGRQRIINDDLLVRQGNMLGRNENLMGRNENLMGRNIADNDILTTRGSMGVGINRNKNLNVDMNIDNDNLPTTSVNNNRLVHVNRRRLNQKIAMQNNFMGQTGQIDDVLINDRLQNIRRGGVWNMDNQINNDRDTFMQLVYGRRVMNGRRVVDSDNDVIGQRNTIRTDDNNSGRIGGRWNKDLNVNQDENVRSMWNRRSNLGRGMGSIGDTQREIDLNMQHIGGGKINENIWQNRRVVNDDDELDLIKGSLRQRMPRSLDHMDMGIGMGVDVGLNNKRLLMEHLRGSEVLLHNIQQLMARINLETIALGITDLQGDNINTMTNRMNTRLNNVRLIDNMDQRFAMRMNDMRINNRRNRQMLDNINVIETTLAEVLRQNIGQIIQMHNGIDARDISVINGIIGDVLLGRIDDRINILNIIRDVVLQTENERGLPTVSDVGVLMHNPVARQTVSRILRVIDQTMQELVGTQNRNDLELPGVTINDVIVDKLRTTVDVTDYDLTNLLDNRVVNQMNVQKLVVGRQQRLNHKHFTINIDLTSDRNQQVVVRTLLVPTVDATGRQLSVDQQRMNAIVLDAHLTNLVNGQNLIQRKSIDINWTTRDTTPLTDIYRRVLMALDGNQMVDTTTIVGGSIIGQNGRFPHRLLLPRGRVDGLPMQLLVIVTRVEDVDRNIQQLTGITTNLLDRRNLLNGLGVSSQNLDRLPLRFPLDRSIDNLDQLQNLSNVHIKDVMIMHDDKHL